MLRMVNHHLPMVGDCFAVLADFCGVNIPIAAMLESCKALVT